MQRDYFDVYTWPRVRAIERVVGAGRLSTDPLHHLLCALAAKDFACRVALNPLVRLKVRGQALGEGSPAALRGALQGLGVYALHSMARTALHILFLRTFLVSALHDDRPATPLLWARKIFLASAGTALFVELATYPLLKVRNAVYASTARRSGAAAACARIYAQAGLRGFYHCFSLSLSLQLLHCLAISALLCHFSFGAGASTRVSVVLSTSIAGALLFPLDTICKRAQAQRANVRPGLYLRSALAGQQRLGWKRAYSGLPHFLLVNLLTNAFILHRFKLANFSGQTLE